MPRPFRFGVVLTAAGSRSEWMAKCRRAESLGYDVIAAPDHLGNPAPFVSLLLAAEATHRVRVSTFVLNTGFWNPVLLARDAFTTDQLTDGRLELGLGTGYVRSQFERVGLPWQPAGRRVDHLDATMVELDKLADDPTFVPRPRQRPRPRVLVGGNGDRVLRLAATRAEIVSLTGARPVRGDPPLALLDADALEERVRFARAAADGRDIELNVPVQDVAPGANRRRAAERFTRMAAGLTVEQRLEAPTFLAGTPRDIADQLRERRERFGFTYITVRENALDALAPAIELVK